jgi:hypothetical protein
LLVFQAPTIESARSIEAGFDAEFLRTSAESFVPDRFEADGIRRDYTRIRSSLYAPVRESTIPNPCIGRTISRNVVSIVSA